MDRLWDLLASLAPVLIAVAVLAIVLALAGIQLGLPQGGALTWFFASFSAILAALTAPYVAESLRAHVFCPILSISCEPRTPWYQAMSSVPAGQPFADAHEVFDSVVHFYRIRVENTGYREAKDCEVLVERIWFQKSGLWHEIGFWEPVNLHWAGDTEQKPNRVLNRQRFAYCDVGSVPTEVAVAKTVHFSVDWPAHPSGPRFVLALLTRFRAQPTALPVGRYVVQVSAYATQASPARVFLELEFRPPKGRIVGSYADGVALEDTSLRVTERPSSNAVLTTHLYNLQLPDEDLLPYAKFQPQVEAAGPLSKETN